MNDRSVGPAVAPREVSAVSRGGKAWAGVQSGLAGGLLMLALLSVCAAFAGLGWLQPLAAIGATAVSGAPGGLMAVVAGLVLHAVVSAGFGVAFAAVLPDDSPGTSAVSVGIGYGLFVAGLMQSLVVPAVSPEFRGAAQPIGGSWVVAHGLFGGALAFALVRRRRATSHLPDEAAASRPGVPHHGRAR